jgi:hypothetical protein
VVKIVCVFQICSFHGRNFHRVFFSLFFELFLSAFGQAGKYFPYVFRFMISFIESLSVLLRLWRAIFVFGLRCRFTIFFARSLVGVTHPDACQLFFRENFALRVFV